RVLEAAPLSDDPVSSRPPSSLDPTPPPSATDASLETLGASYTLKPRASRHGLIAVGVTGLIAIGAIVALMTSRPSPANAPATVASAPPEAPPETHTTAAPDATTAPSAAPAESSEPN